MSRQGKRNRRDMREDEDDLAFMSGNIDSDDDPLASAAIASVRLPDHSGTEGTSSQLLSCDVQVPDVPPSIFLPLPPTPSFSMSEPGPPVAPILSPKETAPHDLAKGSSHQPVETSGLMFLPTQQDTSLPASTVVPHMQDDDMQEDMQEDIENYYDYSEGVYAEAWEDLPDPPEDFETFFDCQDFEGGVSRDDLLYSGADTSVETAMIALLTFVMAHTLSKHSLDDLLSLLQLLLPKDNKLCKSAHLFFSFFSEFQSPVAKKFYCQNCTEMLSSISEVCHRCGPGKGVSYFIQTSVIERLKKMLAVPGFYDMLSYPTKRVKKDNDAYEDLYDGAVYKEAVRDYFSEGNWLSLMWNSDGFALFRSSTFQIWPFYLVVNELPPHLRFKRENMILAGLWFGQGKFDPNLFLQPIYEELKLLKRGVEFLIPSLPNPLVLKVGLLCGTCDTPAKSLFFNHINFNGLYGCPKCLIRGEKSERTGKVFVYPYQEVLRPRTDEGRAQHLDYLKNNPNKKVRFGVKGPTYLEVMLLSSMIRSTACDTMHCLFLGCMKSLLHLWFDDKHKSEQFSLRKNIKVVSDYLCSLKPPHFIERAPQSIEKLAFWKASEFQSFFFYYSLPILSKVMDQVYFNHFKLLYHGVSLLYKESVTVADIVLSRLLLKEYVKRHEVLYGVRWMNFNLHVIQHLPDVVELLGPLFTSTCFMFEDFNGCLKNLVHGTQYSALQVHSAFELLTSLPIFIDKLPESPWKGLCKKMLAAYSRLHISLCIDVNMNVVGPISKTVVLDGIARQFLQTLQGNIFYFKRLKIENCLYIASTDNPGRKNSSFVLYMHDGSKYHGILHIFTKESNCHCVEVCKCESQFKAVIQRMNCYSEFSTIEPMSRIDLAQRYTLSNVIDHVNIVNILSVCVRSQIEDKMYVIDLINKCNHQ